jgi:arabinogalactan endo-1,4-beta-galactosidase
MQTRDDGRARSRRPISRSRETPIFKLAVVNSRIPPLPLAIALGEGYARKRHLKTGKDFIKGAGLVAVCWGMLALDSGSRLNAQGISAARIVGADVSFLRQMEQQGVVFKDGGTPDSGLQILKNHGYSWVRLRLFVNPETLPNNLAYTLASARDAKAMGFKILLDLHYADDWADPAHQPTPKVWKSLDHAQLVTAVFDYTRDTIRAFRDAGVMPEMVQVGNEVTNGFLWPDGKLPDHWDRFASLVAAGIQGVDAGRGDAPRPSIMIHIDQGGNQAVTKWFFDNLKSRGIAFDIIGQSYYPWWQGSLEDLRRNLQFMSKTYRKDIVIAETAYDWRTGEKFGSMKKPFPETPLGQREFLQALATVAFQTPGSRCVGLFWWEPTADGAIAKRALFDDNHNALPAIHVFDPPPSTPTQ